MNEKACMASHVHPFFVFTCFPSNPDYRKKKFERRLEKCVASEEEKKIIKQQQQPRSHARPSNDVYSFPMFVFCLSFRPYGVTTLL